MVNFSISGQISFGNEVSVKSEIEDSLDDQHGPFNKKRKHSLNSKQVTSGNNLFSASPSEYNPLNEPSPLGLRLRKSPSLLELIQMRLSQGSSSALASAPSDDVQSSDKVNTKASASASASAGAGAGAGAGLADKLKASNFPASLLKIGHWEYTSRYEGDLVAKCYFAKHKLVWEILEGGLKSKIEIQWSDIMGLKADFPDDAPATLVVVLLRQPLFFRETNPQPRKHTLWQATGDFTDGQASLHRKHHLQIPNGLLDKHFEKLIQCDMRLNFLSKQPEITMNSPYFESQPVSFEDTSEGKTRSLDIGKTSRGLSSIFEDIGTPSVSQSSSISFKQEDNIHGAPEIMSRYTCSPSSAISTGAVEGSSSGEVKMKGSKSFEQLIMQGLRPSMSMTDIVNHIGNCITEQIGTENPNLTEEGSESHKILEDIAQHLLSDVQFTSCSDEKSLMSRVDSLCSLLQKDGTPIQSIEIPEEVKNVKTEPQNPEPVNWDFSKDKQGQSMPRIDSFGDLLLQLPRIASLPKFLFDISEDGDNQAR